MVPEIVYVTLRFLFLALLYVFVFLVARVVYRELKPVSRPPVERAAAKASRRKRKAVLVVPNGGRRKQASWELEEEEAIIGRAPECAITIDDEYTSNLHAKVYRAEQRFYIEDLGSTNGTYVNGRRINYPTELRGGDRIKIGRTEMEFRR